MPAEAEITEKKSRFISHILPVTTESAATEFIASIKTKYWDASHNVYAYSLKDNNIRRYSDDGEPSGTAGMPTLDVICKEGLFDVCVVTTRYFGGTLLGAGGLVRAYTKAAKCGIDAAGIVKRVFCHEYSVRADYSLIGIIKNAAAAIGCIEGTPVYAEDVTLKVFVPHTVTDFTDEIIGATNGRAVITKETEGRYMDAN